MRQSESSRSIDATRASLPGSTSCCIAVSKSVLPTRIEPPNSRAVAITTGSGNGRINANGGSAQSVQIA